MSESLKPVAALAISATGNMLAWVASSDIGALATQITTLSAAIGGAIWLVGQGLLKLIRAFLEAWLAYQIKRDKRLGRGVIGENQDLKAEVLRLRGMLRKVGGEVQENTNAIKDIKSAVARKARVLIVEDHDDSANALATLLSAAGYDCVRAASVDEAEPLLSRSLAFVLLDLMLPGRNGLELLKKIKGGSYTCKVGVMTASGDPSMLREADRWMADMLWTKPLDFPAMLAEMESAKDRLARPRMSDLDLPRLRVEDAEDRGGRP